MKAQLLLFHDTKPEEKERVGQLLIIRFFMSSERLPLKSFVHLYYLQPNYALWPLKLMR